ncbi:MAG: alpha/beta fold hydrolase, partial [Actinomycetota bacterium]
LITDLGHASAHVVGTSYGAYTALLLATRHPERVNALVLGDPPVLPLLGEMPEGRPFRDEFLESVWKPAGAMAQRGEIESAIRVFVDGVVEEGAYDSFPSEVQDLIKQNACEFQVETSSPDFWTSFTCDEARDVTTATLLLTGDRSLKMFQLIVDQLARCLPNNESMRVPETTHLVNFDNPDAYNEIVLGFLARHTGS